MFLNYRRDDTGWAANVVADALCRHLGQCAEVFLDSRSVSLGAAFGRSLEDGVRRSAVLLALIGPRWDEPPLRDRLADPADWVRKEILLARENCPIVVPLLVDRTDVPQADALPEALRFLLELQAAHVHQQDGRSPEVLAERIAGLLPPPCVGRSLPTRPRPGVPRIRLRLDALLRSILLPEQQRDGNRDRLTELAFALLTPADTLVYLAPARLGAPNVSTTVLVLVLAAAVLVAQVDDDLRILGVIRLPLSSIRQVEHLQTSLGPRARSALADTVVVHTAAGDEVRLQSLSEGQAQRLVEYLRTGEQVEVTRSLLTVEQQPPICDGALRVVREPASGAAADTGGSGGSALRSTLAALAGRWDQLILGLLPSGRARLQRVAAPGSDDTLARFAEFYRRDRGRLVRAARQLLAAGQDVDEVLDRAYAGVVAKTADPESFARIIKPEAYFITAVLREVGRAGQERVDGQPPASPGEMGSDLGFSEDEPLLAALALLPEGQRECTILHLVYGFDVRETAAVLHTPIATVTATVERALENARQLLSEEER